MLQTFVSSGTLTVGVGVLCALLITSLTIILLTICMLCYIYRVWTKRRALNARANITELTPVYDDVDVSCSATITVNQSRVDQSGVNHSLMLRDGGACTRGPPPPKPQPYSGKPVSVLQQTHDNPFSNILGKTTEPAPVYDYVDVSRSATITVNQSGVNQSGVDQSGVNQSGVDQSGVNHSLMLRDGGACTRGPPPPKPQPYSGKPVSVLQQTHDDPFSNILGKTTEPAPVYDYVDVSRSATITVNQSGVNQSGVDQSGVNQSGVNQSGVNHSLMLRDGGACTRGPTPPKPQPYSGKPVSALQQTHDDPFSNLLGEITEPAPVYEQVDDLHPGEFIMIENAAYGQCSHSPYHTTTTIM